MQKMPEKAIIDLCKYRDPNLWVYSSHTLVVIEMISDLEESLHASDWSIIILFIIHSKYFPFSDWLKPHAYIIHHNQLLFTKFGKKVHHIESKTSKVQPAADYWTDDVKMTSKVQPAANYWSVDRKKAGDEIVLFLLSRKSLQVGLEVWAKKIFWMNTAIIEFGFRRIWRILQISQDVIHLSLRPWWITPSSTCRILHILLSLIQ